MQDTGVRSLMISGDHLVEINLNHHPLKRVPFSEFFLEKSSFDVPNLKVIHLFGLKYENFKQLDCLPKNTTKIFSVVLNRETDLNALIFQLQQIGNIQVQLNAKSVLMDLILKFMQTFPTKSMVGLKAS